jgi:hypothetical protein
VLTGNERQQTEQEEIAITQAIPQPADPVGMSTALAIM